MSNIKTNEWHWEGNVVEKVAAHFGREGWVIEKIANTQTHEKGADIEARKAGRRLLVEVKGFPSTTYQRGEKAGAAKPTHPKTQARHWYSEALFAAILRQHEAPEAEVVMAFAEVDDFYQKLITRTRHALDKLGIKAYLVDKAGAVELAK